jgi:hypothetical protein
MCDISVLLLAAKLLLVADSHWSSTTNTNCDPCSCPTDDFGAACLEYQAAEARSRQAQFSSIRETIAACEAGRG